MKTPQGPTPWKGNESVKPTFHYNREEREATRQRIWEPPSGSFFRRNRGLTLTIIDLVVVLMLFAIITFVVAPMQSRGRINGYRFSGEAVHFDGEVLVLVSVVDTAGRSRGESPIDNVISVSVAGDEVLDLVPLAGVTRTIRLRTAAVDAIGAMRGNDLAVDVRIGDQTRTLNVSVSGEPVPVPDTPR